MKMRKEIGHNDLIAETIAQLSIRFQPKVPNIKVHMHMCICVCAYIYIHIYHAASLMISHPVSAHLCLCIVFHVALY